MGGLVTVLALAGVALALLLLSREAVALRTGPTGCYLSFIEGQLVDDPADGLIIHEGSGPGAPGDGEHTIIWPVGYTAHRWLGAVEVFDRRRRFVARTGDHVHFSGGYDSAANWLVCGLEMLP